MSDDRSHKYERALRLIADDNLPWACSSFQDLAAKVLAPTHGHAAETFGSDRCAICGGDIREDCHE